MSTTTFPRTNARSHQLVAASQRTSLDPFEYVDWSLPIDDSAFHLPPELLPLYGTPAWDAMSETEQIAYSRHETAALCGAGVWFENVLMQVVLRHLADMPVTDPAHRYLLVEVADECRHSTPLRALLPKAFAPVATDSGNVRRNSRCQITPERCSCAAPGFRASLHRGASWCSTM